MNQIIIDRKIRQEKKIIIKTSQQNETEEEEVDFYCAYDFKKKLINELNSPSFY